MKEKGQCVAGQHLVGEKWRFLYAGDTSSIGHPAPTIKLIRSTDRAGAAATPFQMRKVTFIGIRMHAPSGDANDCSS